MPQRPEIRHLVVVLGDQLDRASSAFDGFDPACDRVWMCEASEESTHVWCSRQRITIFLSAMRHFAAALRSEGVPLLRGRKQLRMEFFYLEMRLRHRVLLDGDQPAGGAWNFDADNREAFGPNGPGFVPATPRFEPDAVTQGVIELVETQFSTHPGSVATFG